MSEARDRLPVPLGGTNRREPADLLARAFSSFDQAAATLQESYRALTTRLERMDLELAASNQALRVNLRENEEMRRHLAAVLESLSTGVIVADHDGRITRCNQAASTFLQRPGSRLLGYEVARVLREAGIDQREYPITAPSGALLSITSTRLQQPPGADSGLIVLLHDVTAIHRLEERMQRRDRLAAMGEMVGRIAHEIRNPLGSVELFASLLRRDLSDRPTQRAYADHISGAVQALNRLLSNLLLYTKPDRPQAAWHEVDSLLLDSLTLAAHAITRAPIQIPLQVDPEVPAVWCDAGQIKQILVNLVINAVHAMPDGGTLTLSVTRDITSPSDRARICLEVSDTGQGIDSEHRSRIFDPFFTTKSDGTGLGLAIVHAFVEGHGGRIEVDSQPGQGTTFRIYLPAAPTGEGPSAARSETGADCAGTRS